LAFAEYSRIGRKKHVDLPAMRPAGPTSGREEVRWRGRLELDSIRIAYRELAFGLALPRKRLAEMMERAVAIDGLTTIKSSLGPKETMDRLEAQVKARGMSVFVRIDHAAGAASAGLPLRPTEVLIFGNPNGGTPLMQAAQTIGLDLPLRALVWQDASGDNWLSYNDPVWLARRHGIGGETEAMASKLSAALAAVALAATTSF
jgi:uncharacterized protein (DUF302 family)